jgi:hypothetical protein
MPSFIFHQPDEQRQNCGKPKHVSKNIARPVQRGRTASGTISVGAGPLVAARITSHVFHFGLEGIGTLKREYCARCRRTRCPLGKSVKTRDEIKNFPRPDFFR